MGEKSEKSDLTNGGECDMIEAKKTEKKKSGQDNGVCGG